MRIFDRKLHAAQAKLTGGLSPSALMGAYMDWATHLANQPGRRTFLFQQACQDSVALWQHMLGISKDDLIKPNPEDHRFDDAGWHDFPFWIMQQAFLHAERWWEQATYGVNGVSRRHERMVSFMSRQFLDMLSPSNIPFLNPEVLSVTKKTGGKNLRHGLEHFISDVNVLAQGNAAPLPMQPGLNVAVTPGLVVFRNELIELIQYAPCTAQVRAEPILIVPAWIMKYYILDLLPGNSLVRYLVHQGYTVFCISWLNPGPRQREVHLEDYRVKGVLAAINAVGAITEAPTLHAVGYCLGGTLLTITAAAMARDHDQRLASLTLLAAQTDFSEAGELQLFINEAQLAFLDDLMWSQGYLDSSQMTGAFTMLRSTNLIWSRLVRRYYLGVADRPNDLMSWNQDTTRMPYRMHSEYLWYLFQNNALAEGRFPAAGKPVSVNDIHVPFFVLGTETDHIAPWRSVHKLHLLNSSAITFVLSSSGHNTGIVSAPGHPDRHYRILTRKALGQYRAPDDWLEAAKIVEGSWWPALAKWLDAHSSPPVAPPQMGNEDAGYKPLCAAPGTYVLQR